MKQFKDFLLRGNLIDLAIAVVIGTAFAAVVKALVADLITPLIAAIGGKSNFSSLFFAVNHSKFLYGDLINAMLTFLVIAAVVFFLVVKPTNAFLARLGRLPKDDPVRTCPECLSDVPAGARRCMYCTSVLEPLAES
ncbi:MAG TPA: large conductance mechanosensitive channel protein MscL [Acidimicrobiales bacterium]|nr:large conductance mechanosensitive channel protein MscL [Acidimicrobiales bacterium]